LKINFLVYKLLFCKTCFISYFIDSHNMPPLLQSGSYKKGKTFGFQVLLDFEILSMGPHTALILSF
jgi:hypothetical protein